MPTNIPDDISEAYGSTSTPIKYSRASSSFLNVYNNLSVRSEYTKSDYSYFRKAGADPRNDVEAMQMCAEAYKKVFIIRAVIDMMADFTVQGIRITHPSNSVNRFLEDWRARVEFEKVSERIANIVYRMANCPVYVKYSKVSRGERRITIPTGYTILNPLSLHVIGEEAASFIGQPIYGLKIDSRVKSLIKKIKAGANKDEYLLKLYKKIPPDIIKAVDSGQPYYILDSSRLTVLHYKKDDWQVWATPFLVSVLSNIFRLEKMHLADMSALDGVISQIRLWRLGDLDKMILPTKAQINKLRDILNDLGTGVLDLVWGPELDVKVVETNVHHFLGSEKYKQVMAEIFSGLGIPPALAAYSGDKGFTNNYFSMKTLIERLEYGRDIITKFWDSQFSILQKKLNLSEKPKLSFDYKVLTDESTERRILIDLWDRDIISTETILELCQRDPKLEEIRLQKEEAKRKADEMPEKASPYHNPQWQVSLKKILLMNDMVEPSQIGIKLEHGDTKTPAKKRVPDNDKNFKPKSEGGDGRPPGTKDKMPRRRKNIKPRGSSADLFIWANNAQRELNTIVGRAFLKHVGKKNFRSLTKTEFKQFEDMKFAILLNIPPFSEISPKLVHSIMSSSNLKVKDVCKIRDSLSDANATVDDVRSLQSYIYASVWTS